MAISVSPGGVRAPADESVRPNSTPTATAAAPAAAPRKAAEVVSFFERAKPTAAPAPTPAGQTSLGGRVMRLQDLLAQNAGSTAKAEAAVTARFQALKGDKQYGTEPGLGTSVLEEAIDSPDGQSVDLGADGKFNCMEAALDAQRQFGEQGINADIVVCERPDGTRHAVLDLGGGKLYDPSAVLLGQSPNITQLPGKEVGRTSYSERKAAFAAAAQAKAEGRDPSAAAEQALSPKALASAKLEANLETSEDGGGAPPPEEHHDAPPPPEDKTENAPPPPEDKKESLPPPEKKDDGDLALKKTFARHAESVDEVDTAPAPSPNQAAIDQVTTAQAALANLQPDVDAMNAEIDQELAKKQVDTAEARDQIVKDVQAKYAPVVAQQKAQQDALLTGLQALSADPSTLDAPSAQALMSGYQTLAPDRPAEAAAFLAQIKGSGAQPDGLKAALTKQLGAEPLKESFSLIYSASIPALADQAAHSGDVATKLPQFNAALQAATDPSLLKDGDQAQSLANQLNAFVTGDAKGTGTDFRALAKQHPSGPLGAVLQAGVAFKRANAEVKGRTEDELNGKFFAFDGRRPPIIGHYDPSKIDVDFLGEPRPMDGGAAPPNGEKWVHINGLDTNVKDFANELYDIQGASGRSAVGIYLKKGDWDVIAAIGDKYRIGDNPTADMLIGVLKDKLQSGEPLNLSGYSRGAIVVGRALNTAKNQLVGEVGEAEALERLHNLNVETYGGAETSYVSGPRYVHYVNLADFVPGSFGLGDGRGPFNFIQDPGGQDAVVRYFYDRGNINNPQFGPHLIGTYMAHRRPFETLANGPKGKSFEFSQEAWQTSQIEAADIRSLQSEGAPFPITTKLSRTTLSDEAKGLLVGQLKDNHGVLDKELDQLFGTDADGRYKQADAGAERQQMISLLKTAMAQGQLTQADLKRKVDLEPWADAWKSMLEEAGITVSA